MARLFSFAFLLLFASVSSPAVAQDPGVVAIATHKPRFVAAGSAPGKVIDASNAAVLDGAVRPSAAGIITGRVTAKATGQGLSGADVTVDGTQLRAATGLDGRYRIAAVAPGTYTVRARYIGYAPGTASVTVSADQEATADLALERSAQQLNEVVTTGTVVETEVKALPSPITVITADEISNKHIQQVDQLFRGDVPGIIAWDMGGNDDQTTLYVRGGSQLYGGGQIKTYVDGIELASESFNLATIDPTSIERIELIRGPQASTIYGAEALNGVLQIFTKRGGVEGRPLIQGRVAGGAIQSKWVSQGAVPTYLGNASISGGAGAFSYSLGGGRSYKGEWVRDYSDAENNIYGSLSGGQGWLAVELSGRLKWQNRTIFSDPFYQPYFPVRPRTDLKYENDALGVTLKAQATRHWQHAVTVGVDRLLDELLQQTPGLTTPADTLLAVRNTDFTRFSLLYTTTLQGALSRAVSGSLIAGANVTSYKSIDAVGLTPKSYGSLAHVIFVDREALGDRGYFTQAQLGIADALFLTAGLRAEYNDAFGQSYGLAWSPRAGVSYVRTIGAVTVKSRVSYGKSIRPATQFARDGAVYPFAIYLPNPGIGPETQKGVDAGIDLYAGRWGTLQATYYDQTAGDLIDYVLVTAGVPPVYQFQNVGEIKNTGLELQGSLAPARGLTLSGTYTIAHSKVRRVSPAYTGDLRVGDQLLAIPQHTAGATVSYSAAGWTGSLGLLHSGSWTNTDYVALYDSYFKGVPYRGSGRAYWITYPAFTKLHLTLGRRLGAGVSAFLSAENLTNSYAVEQANSISPRGRTTTAGLDFRF